SDLQIRQKQQETERAYQGEKQTREELVATNKELDAANIRIKREQEQTQEALRQRTEALAREKRTSYFRSIALAQRHCLPNDILQADQVLQECRASLGHWEWRYLQRLCHLELGTIKASLFHLNDLVFLPGGRQFATAASDGVARLWDATTLEPRSTIRCPKVTLSAFSPDGRRLAGLAWDTLQVWDVATGRETLRRKVGFVRGFVFSPDGQ